MRAMFQVLTHGLILLAACAASPERGSQGTKPAEPPASQASRPASRPGAAQRAALDLLQRAAARRAPSGEPQIRDLTIELEAETNVEQHNEFHAAHRFVRPDRIWTRLKTSTTTVERGFDGATYWLRKGGSPTQKLEGREFAKDREEIDASIRFTENLLRLVFLDALSRELSDLVAIEPTAADPRPGVRGNHAAFLTLRDTVAQRSSVELRFDPSSLDLVEVRATRFEAQPSAAAASAPTDVFELSDYRATKEARFPYRVVAYTRDKARPEYNVQVQRVSWNDGIAPEQLAPPK